MTIHAVKLVFGRKLKSQKAEALLRRWAREERQVEDDECDRELDAESNFGIVAWDFWLGVSLTRLCRMDRFPSHLRALDELDPNKLRVWRITHDRGGGLILGVSVSELGDETYEHKRQSFSSLHFLTLHITTFLRQWSMRNRELLKLLPFKAVRARSLVVSYQEEPRLQQLITLADHQLADHQLAESPDTLHVIQDDCNCCS